MVTRATESRCWMAVDGYKLQDLVWPLQQAAFFTSQGRLPHPLAAMLIRAGDKGSESPLRSVDEHFVALAHLARQLSVREVHVGIHYVYVGSYWPKLLEVKLLV